MHFKFMNMTRIFFFLTLALLASCQKQSAESDFKVVYKNDKEGNTLAGSKEALIQCIRAGASIKIGWGSKGKTRSIEHLSEPLWLAVLNETEVIAHLDPHAPATMDWDNLSSSYADTSLINQEWRVVITTKGEFDAIWHDKYNGKLVKRIPQRHPMTWFAKGEIGDNKPLFLNE